MAIVIKMVRCYTCGRKTPHAPPAHPDYQLCHECAGDRPASDDGWGDAPRDSDITDPR